MHERRCTEIISDEQINQIANRFKYEVHRYIMEHRTEYEKFLADELIANDDHPEFNNIIESEENLDGKT